MQSIDTALKKMATEMIYSNGCGATYIQYQNGEYNPSTSSVERVEIRTPIKMCLFEFLRAGNGEKAINNTLTEIADKQAYIAADVVLKANAGVDIVEVTRANGDTQQYIVKVMKEHGCDPSNIVVYDAWLETA